MTAPADTRFAVRAVVLALLLLAGGRRAADAHDLRPGVLSLVEQPDGAFAIRFVPPIDSRGQVTEVTLELPAGCVRTGERVGCEDGLGGELAVIGMRGDAMRTIVVIERLGAEPAEWMLDSARPRVSLGATAPSGIGAWIWLGIEHILGGPDHLAFVLGLLLVLEMRLDRRLLATISAFTIAHSLTLALAVLGVVRLHAAPVEACIALSVLLVAREATHREPTMIRRWPWVAAGVFGLVHGLGFASALGAIGMPRAHLARALVSFNVGVEIGQLATVASVIAIVWGARRLVGERWIVGPRIHRAASYALGAVAAWWLLERLVDLACGVL